MDIKHLSYKQKTNLGSFYTPPHLVRLVYEILARRGNPTWLPLRANGLPLHAVLEPACGYGAFFAEKFPQKNEEIKTRDLGLSFMLAFAKLKPDYIAILHPLSYLIKRTNFETLNPLMQNYELLDAVVFSSQEFTETSKTNGFPIVAAVYAKSERGTSYEQIIKRKFRTLEKQEFSISDFDYVCRYIPKYPSRYSKAGGFKFFTMRDINALKRSRTFIEEDTANTIHIPQEKLPYYCYVDIFKDIANKLPYYFGNLDVPFDKNNFEKLKDDFFALSVAKHPDIFAGKFSIPNSERLNFAKTKVQNYFNNLFKGMNI